MNDLIITKLDGANKLLVEARTIQQANHVIAIASAAEVYAKRQKLGEEAIGYAHEIKTHALRKLGEMLKASKENGHFQAHRPNKCSDAEQLSDIGIDRKVSMLAQQIADLPMEKVEAVAMRVQTLTDIQREQKEEKREAHRSRNAALVGQAETIDEIVSSGARFTTVCADPPWDWGDEGDVDQFGRGKPTYLTIPFDELLRYPLGQLADKNAHLYLWITNRSLPKGFQLVEAWGFRYVTCLTWCSRNFGPSG